MSQYHFFFPNFLLLLLLKENVLDGNSVCFSFSKWTATTTTCPFVFYERERQVKATKWVIRPMCRPPLCSLPPPEKKKKKFFFLESQFLVFYIEGDPFYIHFHSKEEKHRPSEATGLSLYPRPNNISSDQSISGEPKKRSKFFFFLFLFSHFISQSFFFLCFGAKQRRVREC